MTSVYTTVEESGSDPESDSDVVVEKSEDGVQLVERSPSSSISLPSPSPCQCGESMCTHDTQWPKPNKAESETDEPMSDVSSQATLALDEDGDVEPLARKLFRKRSCVDVVQESMKDAEVQGLRKDGCHVKLLHVEPWWVQQNEWLVGAGFSSSNLLLFSPSKGGPHVRVLRIAGGASHR